jgi:hypothetical protein
MAFMWQYQVLAELPPANNSTGGWDERIDIGKWAPRLPDIQFRLRYLSKAIMPDISTEPRMIGWLERMTPDKWGPCLPARRYEREYLSAPNQPYFTVAPLMSWMQSIDKWGPILPARRYEKAYLTAAIMPQGAHLEKPWYDGNAALTFIMEKTRTHF